MKKRLFASVLAGTMLMSAMSVLAEETKKPQDIEVPEIDFSTWATAADNGFELPEIEGGVLEIEVNIADFNQSSEGTMVQALWEQAMEHYLGVDLEVKFNRTAWADYRGQETTRLAADDIADINTYSWKEAVNEYGEDEVVLNLAEYADYIKYYWDYVDGHPNGEAIAKNPDGSMYYFIDAINNADDIMGAQSFTAFAYRFDVLKENNLAPATTLEEFTKLCADLKALIDDGTIDADYVLMNSTKDYAFYRGLVGIFHTWDTLYWNGTEWSFGPIEDNFREMLKYINGLYEAGYIDPEFATADSNAANEKGSTGSALICPTLWSGSAQGWNNAAAEDSGIEWGLAWLPEDETYGTPWKWGSKLPGKSLNVQMGIIIDADVEYPEYLVAMVDYQYSDEMTTLLNWGVEGITYNVNEDGTLTFVDSILNADSPATESAIYGTSASCVCRTGIPFVPQNFSALVQVSATTEPWWSPEDGYYEGKYWIESDRLGGVDSVSPYDRPAALNLDSEQSAAKSNLSTVCETYAKGEVVKFITGELDIEDDEAWADYIEAVKSQTDEDFDETIEMLNENSIVIEY